jgi:pyruvate/2-oxoglutarate/acetoin dehydrogenase E1 component/TPP-dependent pyruvate/acetoin dehydrogenase alpha subunit
MKKNTKTANKQAHTLNGTEHAVEATALSKEEILNDYRIGWESRHASLLGRKEVFSGKAKFGIFGDGKELPLIAMSKVYKHGDFRSGYYRDQTLAFLLNTQTLEQYFSQLYANMNIEAEPVSGGRTMNGHYSTHFLDENGHWNDLTKRYNFSSDISPTAGQMPRLVGLGYASRLFKENEQLHQYTQFSNKGREIVFGTIGDASTSEGLFFESINAIGVLRAPVIMSVMDNGFGISVPKKYHTTKGEISEMLAGLQRDGKGDGFEVMRVKAWDYLALIETYQKAENYCRGEGVPCLVHVSELTQPQGHSSSGSHERYKSKERLAWEAEYDCLRQFKLFIIAEGIATEEELNEIEANAQKKVKEAKDRAWKAFINSMKADYIDALSLLEDASKTSAIGEKIAQIRENLKTTVNPIRLDAVKAVKGALRLLAGENSAAKDALINWLDRFWAENHCRYASHMYSESAESAMKVSEIAAVYDENSPVVDGREIVQACFDAILAREPRFLAFGEDVGFLGDVNQGFAGLQAKYGELRVQDTGIREATIVGQGIGLAMRGLRPLAEIQYLDYLLYALQIMSDDLATLQYRTVGRQKAPLIIRTRGHRLEGIWHSGSPIGGILHLCRGIYLLVPRNMTQAAGFYNTMIKSDDAALLIECLNGYRLKEKMPNNIAEFTVPLGVPEVLRYGTDVTVVTYGSMCRIVMDAAEQLAAFGISAEVIDVQTLLPFDIHHSIVESVKKTNRVIFTDEDVPGGASAYMMQKVLEGQDAYRYLDAKPVCVSSKEHRPAYTSDGDYFSKPNADDIFDAAYEMMSEAKPALFPRLYR